MLPFGTRLTDDLYTAGQPSRAELAALASQGFCRVIDLRPPGEDRGFDEPACAVGAGLEYLALPIAGEADLTLPAVRTLDRWLSQPGAPKTLLHCASGNRVGALLALRAGWLQELGVTTALEVGRYAGMKSLEAVVSNALSKRPPDRYGRFKA